MSLSDKRCKSYQDFIYFEKDVKEFIRKLKEEIMKVHPLSVIAQHDVIDKLAGEELIK